MAHGEYNHIEIRADDTSRAQRFYGELFGWDFTEMPDFPGYFLYTTAAGQEGTGGAIGKRGESAGEGIRNYIEVDSIDQTLQRVEQFGGSATTQRSEVPGQGWFAVLNDSEGNEIGLWENLPR